MNPTQNIDPMHGMSLEKIINYLVDYYGWEELGSLIDIRCFNSDPSVKSSLKFLRKTPWARKKVEDLYVLVWGYAQDAERRITSVADNGGIIPIVRHQEADEVEETGSDDPEQ